MENTIEYNAAFLYDISIRGNILHDYKGGYGSSEEEALEQGKERIRRELLGKYRGECPIVGEIVAFTYQGTATVAEMVLAKGKVENLDMRTKRTAKNIKKHIILL